MRVDISIGRVDTPIYILDGTIEGLGGHSIVGWKGLGKIKVRRKQKSTTTVFVHLCMPSTCFYVETKG